MPSKPVKQTAPATTADLQTLLQEMIGAFHDLRDAGQRTGLITDRASSTWGLLRSLAEDGPIAMSDFARRHSVSRQYIHKIARVPLREGWITLEPNPADRRAPRMTITPRGEDRLRAHQEQVDRSLAAMCEYFAAEDVAKAATTVALVRSLLDATRSAAEVPPRRARSRKARN